MTGSSVDSRRGSAGGAGWRDRCVFGDIGTSPIYTLQTVFNPTDPHPVPVTEENVLGVVSLTFWSVVLIVTVTYVLLAMRVDNDGEGGIMVLITLLLRKAPGSRARLVRFLVGLGVLGASLFLGDSMITPAISVLSAVEGLKVVDPGLEQWVVPITAVIIVGLFTAQRFGTAAVGRLFGPVMIGWFVAIAACGVWGITDNPGIFKAVLPTYALGFLAGHFDLAFFALAAIVLSVTGAEALYGDMGHFGRRPISIAWLFLVFPARRQLLREGRPHPEGHRQHQSPVLPDDTAVGAAADGRPGHRGDRHRLPGRHHGAFSVTSQAAELGYLPRLRILHTSALPGVERVSRTPGS
jgi:KUP system potassium uptake protein